MARGPRDPLALGGDVRHPAVRRMQATQATVDRFDGKPFGWSSNDCGRLVAFHLRRMGYKAPMPKSGSYRDAKSAMRTMKELTGQTRMEDVLSEHFGLRPIAFAEALSGDLCSMRAADGEPWAAMCLVLDNGRVLAWWLNPLNDLCFSAVATIRPEDVTGAWRVEPQ